MASNSTDTSLIPIEIIRDILFLYEPNVLLDSETKKALRQALSELNLLEDNALEDLTPSKSCLDTIIGYQDGKIESPMTLGSYIDICKTINRLNHLLNNNSHFQLRLENSPTVGFFRLQTSVNSHGMETLVRSISIRSLNDIQHIQENLNNLLTRIQEKYNDVYDSWPTVTGSEVCTSTFLILFSIMVVSYLIYNIVNPSSSSAVGTSIAIILIPYLYKSIQSNYKNMIYSNMIYNVIPDNINSWLQKSIRTKDYGNVTRFQLVQRILSNAQQILELQDNT